MDWTEEERLAMSSYAEWDRAAYIERVGGELEAERRRGALMALQSDQRLADEPHESGADRRPDPMP